MAGHFAPTGSRTGSLSHDGVPLVEADTDRHDDKSLFSFARQSTIRRSLRLTFLNSLTILQIII